LNLTASNAFFAGCADDDYLPREAVLLDYLSGCKASGNGGDRNEIVAACMA
jgi:hypothetical protein